jgi:serine/threonine protein kinase
LTDHDRAARQIAQDAARLPPGPRASLIQARCAGDAALRTRVEALLSAQDAATMAGATPEPPTSSAAPSPSPSPVEQSMGPAGGLPRRLGAYTLLEILGEGGMGTVFLAQQERPRRTVALKVIRAGVLSPRLLRRFEFESQMLGRLQHPGIAAIYEAATADAGSGPQPFFAMELVRGLPLTDHARAANLGVREKLELLAKVCDAVHHAHQQGVIHRDLKPGNILVDQHGQPKILDFGVARSADAEGASASTLRTEAGQLVGTLPYMSPEQVGGDPLAVDTRSDVYALGVILYELLTGKLPHVLSDKTIPDALRTIAESVPVSLGSIDRSLRGDVATIVDHALEKDKARRYPSAAEFAADLRRYLRDEPIQARPASTLYQWRKFAQRNRALVGAIAAAFVLLVAGTISTALLAVDARAKARLAAEEAQNAQSVTDFLIAALSSASPEEAAQREPTIRELLDASAESLEQQALPPRVEASIRQTLATTYRAIGQAARAEPFARRAVELSAQVHGPMSRESVLARITLAGLLSEQGKIDEALSMGNDLLAKVQASHQPGDFEVGLAMGLLGRVHLEHGHFKDAEPLLSRSAEIVTAAAGPTDRESLVQRDHLGSVYAQLGRFDKAEEILRALLADRERILGPRHPVTAFTLNSLANAIQKQGRNEEALELLKRALDIRKERLAPGHPSLMVALGNLAVTYVGLGRHAEALPLFREAAAGQVQALGPDHPKTLLAMGNLAYCLEELNQLDEAEQIYRGVVDSRRRTGLDNAEAWPQMNNLASLLQRRGRPEQAEPLFREILSLASPRLPENHYMLGIFHSNQGDCLTDLKDYSGAERALLQGQAILSAFFGPKHARTIKGQQRLLKLYEASGQADKAAAVRAQLPPG